MGRLPIDGSFLELIPAAAYAVSADGAIAYFNAQAAELWGQTPAIGEPEWRWCGAFEIFEEDGRPIDKEQCLIVDVVRRGVTVKDYPLQVLRPDGSRIHVRASVGPIRDAEGRVVGAINTFRDVTEDRRSAERLRRMADDAAAANAAKDRFLAMLSHELRTPLAPVVMTVAAMEQSTDLPERVREDVSTIRRNVELEVKLIDDLLDLSRVANGKMALERRPVRVHELLGHVMACCLSDTQGKRLTVRREFTAGNDHVLADPARLQQVFWNLARNATKFTPAGGTITIRTRNEGDALRVEVADTGVGMRPEVLAKVFDAFEQGDGHADGSRAGGLGLGLAIAKAVVDLHGGCICAASDGPGRGATFTVRLETIEPTGASADQGTRPATSRQSHRARRILLVEDHGDTAKVLGRLLRMNGYAVEAVGTVAAALEAAARQPFDLMVSDIGLPDASGYDLMRLVRQRHGLRGVALSGYGMEGDVREGRAAGFEAHVTKPVDLNRLMAVIEQVAGEE